MFYVYIHCKPDGSPFYVGKGRGQRARSFNHGRNPFHKRTVAKYGRENIQVLIIPCVSEEEALSSEISLIKSFKDLGYQLTNLTDGGEGASGLKLSEETKQKMSIAHFGKVRSAEARANISAGLKGRVFSEEWRAKIGATSRGRKHSEATKLQISEKLKGKTRPQRSADWSARISASKKGRPAWNKGIKKCL